MPFNAGAMEVVGRQVGRHPLHGFTYDGNPVKQVSTKGWETPAMVRRYVHLASEHLAAYAGKVGMVAANDNRPPVT